MARVSLLGLLLVVTGCHGGGDGTVADAASADAVGDAAIDDDADIDAAEPPPPACTVDAQLAIADVTHVVRSLQGAVTGDGWLFAYGVGDVADSAVYWTLIGFDGQALVPPTLLANHVNPYGSVAVAGGRALVGMTATGPDGPIVRVITLATRGVGPSIPLGADGILVSAMSGPGGGFRIITGVQDHDPGTSWYWFRPSLRTVGSDGAVGVPVALPDESGVGIGLGLADGSAAVALSHERPFDNCFACEDAGLGRIDAGGAWSEPWMLPIAPHHASQVTSLAEIHGRVHVAWQAESPSFYVPVWFATLARDPDEIVLMLPWVSRIAMAAGGPRDGVIGGARATAPDLYFLQTFDSDDAFTLGGTCGLDLAPAQLLAAPDGRVLVVADDGRARIVRPLP